MQSESKEGTIIKIKCFGKLSIYVNGVEQSALMNSMKARELIAYLMISKGEAVRKRKVGEALWEDKTEKKRNDSLYKLVRKIEQMPIPFIIKKSRELIQLRLDNVECDLLRFERLIADKDNVESKERAVELYRRGPLLEQENYNWICMEDGRYDYVYMEILDELQQYYEGRDRKKAAYYSRLMDECE